MVSVAAVWPEAVGVGGGLKMTAEMCIGDLCEAVPAGGGVNRRLLAAARAVIPVTDLEASRVLRAKNVNGNSLLIIPDPKLIYGAALLSMVRRCSVMVRRCSVGRASACCKAGPSSILGSTPQGGFPTELISDEDMERDLGEWRRTNVLCECDSMNVCIS